jgi:hypothetical protein
LRAGRQRSAQTGSGEARHKPSLQPNHHVRVARRDVENIWRAVQAARHVVDTAHILQEVCLRTVGLRARRRRDQQQEQQQQLLPQ